MAKHYCKAWLYAAESDIILLLQERLRLGIEGVHIRSLDQHLDQQMMQQMLGEVLREDPPLEGPDPDLQILSTLVLSRYPTLSMLLHDFAVQIRDTQQPQGHPQCLTRSVSFLHLHLHEAGPSASGPAPDLSTMPAVVLSG